MGEIKFESGQNKDGMLEETAVEAGRELYPLRRSVGMPAFKSEKGKEKFVRAQEKKELESRIREAVFNVYFENRDDPSVEAIIKEFLEENFHIPPENVNMGVEDTPQSYWLEIRNTEYGDLEIDFKR